MHYSLAHVFSRILWLLMQIFPRLKKRRSHGLGGDDFLINIFITDIVEGPKQKSRAYSTTVFTLSREFLGRGTATYVCSLEAVDFFSNQCHFMVPL